MERVRAGTAWILALLFLAWPQALNAQGHRVTISGTVIDSTSGRPVTGVSILRHDSIVATSDDNGHFSVADVTTDGDTVQLLLRRIGYNPLELAIRVPDRMDRVEINVFLQQWPTTLDEIVVEGERVSIRNPGLLGFYRRRADDFGRYLTHEEVQRAMSFDLGRYLQRLRVDQGNADCTRFRPMVYYLDGIRLDYDQINRILPPRQVGGIEVYMDERAARLPPALIPAGPYCGVVVFWSLEPEPPSGVEIAGSYTLRTGVNHTRLGLLGGQIAFPLRQWSTLRFVSGLDLPVGDGDDRWHAFMHADFQPLGWRIPWYLGTGIALVKRGRDPNTLDEPIAVRHLVVTGARFPRGPVGLFAEVRMLNVFRPSDAGLFISSGLIVRLGR